MPYQWVLRRQFIGTYLDSDNVSYDTKASQGLRLQEVSPGVHHVVGGSHNSLIVEMSDFLVIFDAPVTDAQSAWVMSTVKSRFPGKPVRWVVLTHHHMDHAGGVRGLLVDGGTLVVGAPARAHFQKVLAAPMTRNPDLTPRSFAATQIMEVTQSHVITDSRGRQVMMYVMDNPHAKGMMMGWVPDAKLGFVTDIWSPGPAAAGQAEPRPGRRGDHRQEGRHPARALRRRPRRDLRLRLAGEARGSVTSVTPRRGRPLLLEDHPAAAASRP